MAFPFFDIFIRSGDIRDQNLKLRKIVAILGRFFWRCQILRQRAPHNLYSNYHACLAARHLKKFRAVTNISAYAEF